jgi:acyl-CoA thioesterase-2
LAAARTVAHGRDATAMQLLFLQGALLDRPLELQVAALQEGKRFSARQVRGTQGDRLVFDAHVSFTVPLTGPAHMAPAVPASMIDEDPDVLPGIDGLVPGWAGDIERTLGFPTEPMYVLDLRWPDPPKGMKLDLPEPHLRFWVKVRNPLPDDPHLHAAAFAYLSDWWFNYVTVGGHVQELLDSNSSLYCASLNHALWLHRPVRADEWLHFYCVSPCAADGRGLSIARVHDRAGRLVAGATQECLMALRE